MHAMISLIMPYIIVGVVYLMSFINIEYLSTIEALVVGILIGIWMIHVMKTEAKKYVMSLLFVTFILLCVGIAFALMYLETLLPILALCLVLQLFVIGIVSRNKPRLSMTYKYSFKNRRRRYF